MATSVRLKFGASVNRVDTTAPTVSSVSSTAADRTYVADETIPITVLFTAPVTVTGTPQLTLSVGSSYVVDYTSGSGSNTLVFEYVVQPGHVAADLDYVSTSALALNGGTIRTAAMVNATLTLPAPGAAGSLGANKAIVVSTSTYLLEDDLDGYVNDAAAAAAGWTNSGDSPDWGYTTTTLAGYARTCRLDRAASGGWTLSPPFGAQTAIWGFVKFRVNALTANNPLLLLLDEGDVAVGQIEFRITSGYMRIHAGGSTVQPSTAASQIAANTDYWLWWRWAKGTGANAQLDAYLSTTSTRGSVVASVTAGTAVTDVRNVRFSSAASTDTYFNALRISTSEIGDSPVPALHFENTGAITQDLDVGTPTRTRTGTILYDPGSTITLKRFTVALRKVGDVSGINYRARVYATGITSGDLIATSSIVAGSNAWNDTEVHFDFAGVTLNSGTNYAFLLDRVDGLTDASNYVDYRVTETVTGQQTASFDYSNTQQTFTTRDGKIKIWKA